MDKLRVGQTSPVNDVQLGLRDAFHVPGVQTTTDAELEPGTPVRFVDWTCQKVEACSDSEKQALVDPFIDGPVTPGVAFWVFLMPDLANNLTHSFDIKGLPKAEPQEGYGGLPDEDTFEEPDDLGGDCGCT